MKTKATSKEYSRPVGPVLYLALELSARQWKLAFTVGWGQRARLRTRPAGDLEGLRREIELAKGRFALPASCRVVSCFEAGRDGFWIHRFLVSQGVENRVIDAASIETNRRGRRAKTDRLDAERLLSKLVRHDQGEQTVWSLVRVPSVEQEDGRHRQRERATRKKDRTRVVNRIKGLLMTVGVRWPAGRGLAKLELGSLRLWDGAPLPPGLCQRLEGELALYRSIEQRLDELEQRLEAAVSHLAPAQKERRARLTALRGVGPVTTGVLFDELLWREWGNRRQAAALAGLAPSPRQSGDLSREQGISKAGSTRLRAVMGELAWTWVRLQPRSDITLWWRQRFAEGGPRLRRIGIIAVARKLLIALWRYVALGQMPAGAALKA